MVSSYFTCLMLHCLSADSRLEDSGGVSDSESMCSILKAVFRGWNIKGSVWLVLTALDIWILH